MKVHDRNNIGPAAHETGRAAETQKTQKVDRARGTGAGAAEASGDRVELSSALAHISQAISAHSAQRATKVEALAGTYQGGRYHADSHATSHGLVTEALAAGRE